MSMINAAHNVDDEQFIIWANEVDSTLIEHGEQLNTGSIPASAFTSQGELIVGDGTSAYEVLTKGSPGQSLRATTGGLSYGQTYLTGLHAEMPAASGILPGTQYFKTDRKEQWLHDGDEWALVYGVGSTNLLVASGGQFALDRIANAFDNIGTGSQVLKLTYFRAQKTQTVSEIRAWVGTTAAGATPSISRYGLWTANEEGALLSLVASTPNDTSLFTGTVQSAKTKSLSSSYELVKEQYYAVGLLCVTSAAVPNFAGTFVGVDTESGDGERWCGQVSSQSNLPTSISAGTVADASSAVQFQLI